MKRTLRIVGIVLAVIVIALIALPFLIDVNSFRPKLESELTTALGRDVKVGNLRLSILSGSVSAEQLSIADDPAFSKSPFITAKSLDVGVDLMPLIFSKALHVNDITLTQPDISLVHAASGRWNFSSLGGNSSAKPSSSQPAKPAAQEPAKNGESSNPNLSIAKLNVKDGRITVSQQNSSAKPRVYDKVNIEVKNFSFTSQFPFTLTANLPGGGNAKLDGTAGPINSTDASLTPLNAKINVKQLDLGASGFTDPNSGIGGLADFDGTVTSDGKQAKAQGVVSASKLKLSPKGQPAGRPVQVTYAVVHDLAKQSGDVTKGDIVIGKALAQLTGGYQIQGDTTSLNMKLNGQAMPVDDLQAMLPAMGVVLPSGSSLKGGTLSTSLNIVGPTDKLVITGPIKLSDTKLAGFDLGSKLSALSKFTGSGPKTGSDTSIQNLSTNARVAPDGIQTNNVNLTIPALGVLTGAGTISPAGALNYKMNAELSGSAVGGLTQMAGIGGGGGKGGGIPFAIQGTTSSPTFIPDVKGIVGSQLQDQLKSRIPGANTQGSPLEGLSGLLGKKKKK
ncbi:MAG TPA: AsmA family protein [Terriglobales bacterium]|nr:AsmA family protein [Terriglobales bacterium]